MKLSMGSLFGSSKRSAKKKPRSLSLSESQSSGSDDCTSSSNHNHRLSTTPRSVLPPAAASSDESWPSSDPFFPLAGNGRITSHQLEAALRRLAPDPPTEEEVAAVAAAGEISLHDLAALGPPAGDELREAFAVFDTDGDGRISAEELLRVLVALGDDGCSLDDCRRMIREVDTDGDGFVCFDDFARMMMDGHK